MVMLRGIGDPTAGFVVLAFAGAVIRRYWEYVPYGKITNDSWVRFWWVYIIVHVALGVITTMWFLIGGVRDYREMFRLLKIRKSSEEDDGRVLQE